jgi:predicted permease
MSGADKRRPRAGHVSGVQRWLLRAAAPRRDREWLLADLEEEASARARTHGTRDARAWSRRQVLASLIPLLTRRADGWARRFRRSTMMILHHFRSDLALALRRAWSAPGFAVICVLTLALGIGGNTAVFTLVDRVVFEPLPVARPSELYRLGDTDDCCVNSGLAGSFSLFSYDLYTQLAAAAPEFVELAAFQANTRAITIGVPQGDAPAETLDGAFVSGNYFRMLGLSPAAGRLAAPADDRPEAEPVAVISHRAWMQRFQGRHDVVGRTMLFNGVPGTIIGIAPEGFYGETLRPDPPDIWIPLSTEPRLQPAARLLLAKSSHWLYVMGRLLPGTPVEPIERRLTAVLQHWIGSTIQLSADERGRLPQQHVNIVPAASGVSSMREAVTPFLQLLQAVAGVVLLVACANLAALLLGRSLSRRTETAVRTALGASRARLVMQSLTEALALSVAGGLAGLLIANAGARTIIDLTFRGASNVPIDASPSPLVLLFALGTTLVTAVIFGAAPAAIASRADPIDAMRGAGRSTAERGSRLRHSLVALQVALSLVLITCAGLMGRSLTNLQQQDFGFRPDGLYAAALAPSLSITPMEQLETLYRRTQERLLQIPGVTHAAFALYSPMSGDNWASPITVDGRGTAERLVASWNRVGPGYFETVGTPLLRGRTFDERDQSDAPRVAVVSQAFASKFFGDRDPIGRRIGFANSSGAGVREFEIVGVVGDAKYREARLAAQATFFLPFLQQSVERAAGPSARTDRSHYAQALLIRTAPVPALQGEVRRALGDVDSRLIVRTLRPMEEQVAGHFNMERLIARLTIAFGAVALLLACLGIYGVTAHAVTTRTRELGVRMAIGASRRRVLLTVLRGAAVQLTAGLALGLPAAFIAGRLLDSTLFGVSGRDPFVLAAGPIILAAAGLVATLIPARRAATMNPVTALRMD